MTAKCTVDGTYYNAQGCVVLIFSGRASGRKGFVSRVEQPMKGDIFCVFALEMAYPVLRRSRHP